MNKLDLQNFLFDKAPTRLELLEYQPESTYSYRVGIYRNHSFELIEHTINAYLDFAGFTVEFIYSDYDDSLTFVNLDKSVNAIVLWLDMSRYHTDDKTSFIHDRIDYLEKIYEGPILAILTETVISRESRTLFYDLSELREELGIGFFDERLAPFSGTRLSIKACIKISRELGLSLFPAILKATLKAIVVDLDNTLYSGVLGEDGIYGVVLTEGHRHLQQLIKKFGEEGFFLCIVSKNEERDVIGLFNTRNDFPLKIEDFSKLYVSWNSKADSIRLIAEYLNIHTESILFIDDNYGELISVMAEHPSIKLLHAKEDGESTCEILKHYPGLLKQSFSAEDRLRKLDIQANEERRKMNAAMSPEEYIRSLDIKLVFSINDTEKAARVTELAKKTNQFICCYRRYSHAQIEAMLADLSIAVITISLSDRLSDSGIIGVCVAADKGDYVNIEECLISCRALGRGIDQIIVLGAMREALGHFHRKKLKMNFVSGDRNEPAKLFVEKYLLPHTQEPELLSYSYPDDLVAIEIQD